MHYCIYVEIELPIKKRKVKKKKAEGKKANIYTDS